MIRGKMKAIMFEGIDRLVEREIPIPSPKRGEALVKIMASGLCITDVHVLKGQFAHSQPPCVLGHEIAGKIVGFADEQPWEHTLKINDRVVIETMIACGKCKQCLSGFKNLCEQGGDIGEPPYQGGYCEYITMPVECLYKIPESMSYEEAAIFESFVCPVGGINRIGINTADTVLIQGLGPAGLAFLQGARVLGAGKTIVVDYSDKKLKLAKEYGADILVNLKKDDLYKCVMEQTNGKGVEICCEASGAEKAMQACFDLSKKNAKLLFYGIPKDTHEIRFDVTKIITKQLNLYGTSGAPWAWESTLSLYGEGKYNIKEMVTHVFELSEMDKAIETLLDEKQEAIKIVLKSKSNLEE